MPIPSDLAEGSAMLTSKRGVTPGKVPPGSEEKMSVPTEPGDFPLGLPLWISRQC